MSGPSKGEAQRLKKRRERATSAEVKAFEHGMQAARAAIGPEIWKRAAIRGALWGFVLGVCTGSAIVHYFG